MVFYNIEKDIVIPKFMNIRSLTSGDIIFNCLDLCPNKKDIEIQLYGIATTTEDNPDILKYIMFYYKKNKHHQLFLDYINRRHFQNIAPSTNNNQVLKIGRKVISNFKELKITFNEIIYY